MESCVVRRPTSNVHITSMLDCAHAWCEVSRRNCVSELLIFYVFCIHGGHLEILQMTSPKPYYGWTQSMEALGEYGDSDLGDNCIQISHLGRYIVRYVVGNLVLRGRASRAVKRDFERISDNIPPQMKILNMVIPILKHFSSLSSNWSVVSRIKRHIIQLNVT